MELQKIDLQEKNPRIASQAVTETPLVTKEVMDSSPALFTVPKIIMLAVVLALGLGSGYLLKNMSFGGGTSRSAGPIVARNVPEAGLKEGDIIGVQNAKEFKDSTTGVLQKGGVEGEGSHHMLRPGGPSQTVYLTSSVIDLDEFVGHQVTVWGETFKGQKVSWLMDVGRVKVEKLNAPDPK
jgi:hypothetical protein